MTEHWGPEEGQMGVGDAGEEPTAWLDWVGEDRGGSFRGSVGQLGHLSPVARPEVAWSHPESCLP